MSIKERFVLTENKDCTEEWYRLVGLKDSTIFRAEKDVFTLLENGEKIELHKHYVKSQGKKKYMFCIVMGDNIETKIYRLVYVAKPDPDMKLKKQAEKYFRKCLVERLKYLEENPVEETLDVDDIEIEEGAEELIDLDNINIIDDNFFIEV